MRLSLVKITGFQPLAPFFCAVLGHTITTNLNSKELGMIISYFLQVILAEDIVSGSQMLTAALRFEYYAYALTKIMSTHWNNDLSL